MQSLSDSVLDANTKVCSRCGILKPWRDYSIRKDRGRPQPRCRVCDSKRTLARYRRHPRKRPVEKACSACGVVLPIAQFPVRDHKTKWLRAVCRLCKNRKKAEYTAANREKIKASNAAYRQARGVELTERQRAWRVANPERYLKIHSGWRRRNPDASRAIANKRRVLVEQAGPHYTAAEWQAMKARYGFRCLMCGKREPEIRLTVDHIIPISLGGSNTIDNLQPLCGGRPGRQSCNSKKYQRTIDLRPLKQTELLLE